ncbi:type VII secretion target [Paractinoplanes atraurantiacus]|uniref:Excreted virulence factor EspC, type VII ESX diderm n=1 Tax=Paractinoplanes atraurantiacus TaxID=1036182 RepID=A0A285KD88_9ACTN|nr:type VII secretion target [Actinoplanes atraurantiacus]SNY69386.1 Excreted virulence factor EspC, type VII ESX diderm [Actinoplanes atraurantiacus]
MPGDQVRFPAPAVHRHAGTVDGVADALRTARSAVHEVSMDTQAYGQLCQFLPGLLSPIFSLAVGALGDAGEALRETADNLRAAAADTAATDGSAARTIKAATGPLPELPL